MTGAEANGAARAALKRSDRINDQEPLSADGERDAPETLCGDARAVLERLAPDLVHCRVLTPWDVDDFVILCESLARCAAYQWSGASWCGRLAQRCSPL